MAITTIMPRFRISLRVFLLGTALVGAFTGWFVAEWRRNQTRREAITNIAVGDGFVYFEGGLIYGSDQGGGGNRLKLSDVDIWWAAISVNIGSHRKPACDSDLSEVCATSTLETPVLTKADGRADWKWFVDKRV
jgi:hypothetical protein